MLTLRAWTTERDGQIHCDSTAKRVTVLLYLNPSSEVWGQHEGCLRLLRGPRDLEDYAVEVPPVNGTLLVFPNSAQSWHGHKVFTGPALQPAAQLHDDGRQGAQRTAAAPAVGVRQAADPGGIGRGVTGLECFHREWKRLAKRCHCEARSDEAIPCVTSVPRLVKQGIASSLRTSQ